MSDMYKWLSIIKESYRMTFSPGETVKISKTYGGGIGQFIEYSPATGKVVVNIKGSIQELPTDAVESAISDHRTDAQRYDEIDNDIHYLPDLPELSPGEVVHIENLYGSGNGSGFGVFVAYSLDGKSAICNVDSKDESYPIEYITKSVENAGSKEFMSTGNDGSMSPMTYSAQNTGDTVSPRELKGLKMHDIEKWMKIASGENSSAPQVQTMEAYSCECGEYDCEICFPLTESDDDEYYPDEETYPADETYFIVPSETTPGYYEVRSKIFKRWSSHPMLKNAAWIKAQQMNKEWADDNSTGIEEAELDEFAPIAGAIARGVAGSVAKGAASMFADDEIEEDYSDLETEICDICMSQVAAGELTDVNGDQICQYCVNGEEPESLEDFAFGKSKNSASALGNRFKRHTMKTEDVFDDGMDDEFDNEDDFTLVGDRDDADHVPSRPMTSDEDDGIDDEAGNDGIVDVGDSEVDPVDDEANYLPRMKPAQTGDASEDISELIAKISYMQDMGLSMSDNYYDPDKLTMMKPELIKKIYTRVIGESAIPETRIQNITPTFMKESKTTKKTVLNEGADADVVKALKALFGK